MRPSPAFSTLGWFNDPVSRRRSADDSLELANTVIHELDAQHVLRAGQAVFNESFANFVGARGAAAFFRSRGDTARSRKRSSGGGRRESRWARSGRGCIRRSIRAFRAHPGRQRAGRARLAARDTIFAMARDSLRTSVPARVHTIPASALASARLDNAALLGAACVSDGSRPFDAVYDRCGGDLRRAVGQIIAIARGDRQDPFAALRRWVASHVRSDSS